VASTKKHRGFDSLFAIPFLFITAALLSLLMIIILEKFLP